MTDSYTPEQNQKPKKKMGLAKMLTIGFVILVVIRLISVSGDKKPQLSAPKTSQTVATTSEQQPEQSIEKPTEPANTWAYQENKDKMTSKTVYYAGLEATEELEFDFPYNGGSTATFMIRKKDGQNNVMLSVSKGQFMNTIDGGSVRIRFDDKQAKKYSFTSPSDGSTETIFLNAEKEIISKVKASKRMIIEAEFYDSGLKQIEFNTEGLKWKI